MEGETVLLRLCSLCYEPHTMTTPGLRLNVVGKDAVWLKANGTDNTYQTDVLEIGAGEAFDVLFKAPAYAGGANGKPYDTYLLYDRSYAPPTTASSAGWADSGRRSGSIRQARACPPRSRRTREVPRETSTTCGRASGGVRGCGWRSCPRRRAAGPGLLSRHGAASAATAQPSGILCSGDTAQGARRR